MHKSRSVGKARIFSFQYFDASQRFWAIQWPGEAIEGSIVYASFKRVVDAFQRGIEQAHG
jgi:hypothetical protein